MKRKKRYSNLDDVSTRKSYQDIRKWREERRNKVIEDHYVIPQCEEKKVDWIKTNREQTSITWIGHSTFLIQCAGLNIMTDPVWAKRLGFAKRLTKPGLALSELPAIDVVLISHGHYDHLSVRSLRALPGNPVLLVPEGLARMLKRKGFSEVRELPWWEKTEIQNVRFTMVPAQHWTRRTLWDMNTSHWGGWVIQHTETDETIYFAGDSGYFRGFKEIGKNFDIDVALMPIGAYEPEWFMKASHMNPEEAVQAYLELNATVFIPMHYGAYRLADDTVEDALKRLNAEWDRLNLDRDHLRIFTLGETWIRADSS